MPRDYLHNHPQFADLIRIVAEEKGISPALVEKDYWIMHCLSGLQQLKYKFALKGGTSLSKGHGIINRFSEDIDILIEPSPGRDVKTARNQNKPAHIKTRTDFYDWLVTMIAIDGIVKVERDTAFDDTPNMRHYYDLYELLRRPEVQNFIGTDAYKAHKQKRFRQGDNPNIAENEAFLLNDAATRMRYAKAYENSGALYYAGKPTFAQILEEINQWAKKL